jgi:hypothetical protein
MFFSINDYNYSPDLISKELNQIGCLCHSYELREGSTVIEVKITKIVRTRKFGFCRDMSLASEIHGY